MKIFIVGLVLAFIGASHQGFSGLDKEEEIIVDECTNEANADPDVVKDFMDNNNISDDANFKCFLNCFASSITLLKPSGDIDSGVLKATLTEMGLKPEEVDEVVAICAQVTGEDGCDIAYNLVSCIAENAV